MTSVMLELLIILFLVLANGFFSGAEIAIIAAGRGKLQQQADAGNRGAKLALELAKDPNSFLPTVQVGITLIGTLAAAFGGARFSVYLADWLSRAPFDFIVERRESLALGIVVVTLTFVSVVLGELVPKRLALHQANFLAGFVSRPMHWLAFIGRPAVWCMSKSTNAVLWLFRVHDSEGPGVSIEDIRFLLEAGNAQGLLEPVEHKLAVEALRLGDRTVKQIMRPRVDIDAVEVNTPSAEVLGALAMAGFSRLPVYEDNLDQIIGYIHLKDVVRQQYLGWPIELRKLLHPALFVPESLTVDRLLLRFEEHRNQLAIVLDEFGGTEGMVTLEDVLQEIVGVMGTSEQEDHEQEFVLRDDGSWLVDGGVTIEDFAEHLGIDEAAIPSPRHFSTVAGLIIFELDRLPKIGNTITWLNLKLEVVDMDGKRIDRVQVTRLEPPSDTPAE